MKKKRWFDYLWIAEAAYLVLGLFNILFAYLGLLFFSIPLLMALFGGGKAYCNRYCGRGQLLGLLGGKLKLSRNAPPPAFLDVRPDDRRDGPGVCRRAPSKERDLAVDVQAALAMGPGGLGGPVGGAVCLRVFRGDADLQRAGPFDHGAVPPPLLVRVLSHGHHDPGHLYVEIRKGG